MVAVESQRDPSVKLSNQTRATPSTHVVKRALGSQPLEEKRKEYLCIEKEKKALKGSEKKLTEGGIEVLSANKMPQHRVGAAMYTEAIQCLED